MASTNIRLYQIGNNDSAIVYTGEWFENSDSSSTGGQSLYGTRAANSHATFVFNGTFVAAYGAVDGSGANFSYTIDNGDATNVTFPAKNPPDHDLALFTSPELDYGEHALLLSTTQDGPTLWLDYITYTGSELVRRTAPQVDVPQSQPTSPPPTNSALPVGTIVLIVLCSVLFVVVIVIAGVLLHRRRHRWQLNSPEHSKESGFEIMPPSTERDGVHPVEAISVKILAALRSRSRTHPGMARQPPRSSTLFTSVIMGPSSNGTSRR
ncbi:hypothetical protein PHLGIDRAFT_335642 [Phlebiopsis gigantea 11061_1 CR5-6]|uniref:Uncharacterized protein n=1 Tax=Phlebiopsis gigantea (strain 11061_1 CR5-6) TaxID=745531 RepID=A0A0C3RQ38_PHLG1|nr:hypothetical protein PHLGIDRAFT_335642 [Phlebiopsis gigantea 11061_1 CR5-6]